MEVFCGGGGGGRVYESKVSWNICVIKTPSCGSLGDLGGWMVVVVLVGLSAVVLEEIW